MARERGGATAVRPNQKLAMPKVMRKIVRRNSANMPELK